LENDAAEIVDKLIISVGSTPSARHHLNNNTTNSNQMEIHPGNYTLFDRQQLWAGSCVLGKDGKSKDHNVAGRVLSRVIGHYEDRNTILLDAGSLALTKDTTPQGGVCSITDHPELVCTRISQEVMIVTTQDLSIPFPFKDFPLGTVLTLLPNHSCLAAACFDKYYIIDDQTSTFSPEEEIVDVWVPAKYFEPT
jgi:D-serine ammonia-lyase